MATFTGTNAADTANATTGTLVGFTGGSLIELQDGVGDTFLGVADNDIVVAGSGDDTINGGGGSDNLDGKDGNDIYDFNDGDVGNGEIISDTGTSGTDTIRLLGNSINFDLAAATISGIEALLFTQDQNITFSASQLPASLAVTGSNGTFQVLSISGASNFSAAAWSFTDWESTDLILLTGTSVGDTITGSNQNETITGADGDDVLSGGLGDDAIAGGSGNDTASYADSTGVTVSLAIGGPQDTVGAGIDTLILIDNLTGSALGIDTLTGDGLANVLSGLGGNDVLDGGNGNDTLTGGTGKDTLTGGVDADVFDFNRLGESKKGALRDTITDFVRGEDVIDVSGIDAKNGSGNQKFKFIGKQDFHQTAGELHYVKKNGFVFVEGDTNGDGRPDFQIKVDGLMKLVAGDFDL